MPQDAAFFPADHLGRLLDMPLPTATQYYTWADRMERSPLSESYALRSPSPARSMRLSFESPLREPSPAARYRPASPRALSPTRRSSRGFMEPMSPISPVTPLPDYLLPDSRPPRHHGSKEWDVRSPSPVRRHYLSELSTQDPGLSFERSLADTYERSPVAAHRHLVYQANKSLVDRQLRSGPTHRDRTQQARLQNLCSEAGDLLTASIEFQVFLLPHLLVHHRLWALR